MVAEVIINRTAKKLNRTFDYKIPKEYEELVLIGTKVLVPFGKSEKLEEAYIVGIKNSSEYATKDIAGIKDNLTNEQMELARWMAKRYFCSLTECIKLMLAPGTSNKSEKNKTHDKTINVVYLKKEAEEIKFEIQTGVIKNEKHKKVLQFVHDNSGCTVPEIELFTGYTRAVVKTLEKNGYLEIVETKVQRNPLINKNIAKTEKLKLTDEQEKAYMQVAEAIEEKLYERFLLYGVTGSGKTEVYLQLIDKALQKRKNSNGISTRNIINTTNVR